LLLDLFGGSQENAVKKGDRAQVFAAGKRKSSFWVLGKFKVGEPEVFCLESILGEGDSERFREL